MEGQAEKSGNSDIDSLYTRSPKIYVENMNY